MENYNEPAPLKIMDAKREKVSGLIGIAGPSGSGKTFSALLLAAGMLNKGEKLGFIDTERKRSTFYLESPIIRAALPNGWRTIHLDDPYTPERYIQAHDAFEAEGGYGVVITDSVTHEWEGFGGCQDIAENNRLGGSPNWALAKRRHKRFMNKAMYRPFNNIFCLRAREKTAQGKDEKGKMEYIQKGMQPIQEKNFKYEMLIACMMDNKTNMPMANTGDPDDFYKVPEFLHGLFAPNRYITPEDGARVRDWLNAASPINEKLEKLRRDCRDAAYDGVESLQKFWLQLEKSDQLMLGGLYKDECKAIAVEVDTQRGVEAAAAPTSKIM